MKRMIQSQTYTKGDDLLAAKKYIDDALQAMTYLQVSSENKADAKLFSKFGAQLATMSGTLQSHLNYYAVNSSTKVEASDKKYPKGYFDDYYGQTAYEEYGDLVAQECSGMIISKRASDGEEPGGLIYEAERLGIEDFFDLLKCLEGMCYNGKAVEISDYQYKVY